MQLRRANPHPSPSDNAFSDAWEWVKQKPVETMLLGVFSAIFGDGHCGGGGGNVPSNLGDLGGGGGGYDDSYNEDWGGGYDDSTYDYFSDIDPQAALDWLPGADLLGLPSMVGQIGAGEAGLIAGIGLFVIAIMVGMFVAGVALQAAEDIYWLRLLRGQSADLGRSFSVGKFMVPIMVAQILIAFGVFFGILLLIIPGIILALGWIFVGKVAVDKNLGFVDAVTASWRLTDGYKLDLLVMWIISFFLMLGGILACCIGWIPAVAVSQGAFAIFYNRIAEPGNAYLQPGESRGEFGGPPTDQFGSDGGGGNPMGNPPPAGDPYGAEW